MDNRKLLPAQGPNLVEQRGIYQFQPTNTIKYLLKCWVAQLCFSGTESLDGPFENCNLRIGLSGCFQTCPDCLIKSKIKGENKHCKTIFV